MDSRNDTHFANLLIDINALPAAQEEDFQPIAQTYLRVSLISWGIFFFLLLITPPIIFFFIDSIKNDWLTYLLSIGGTLLLWTCNILWVKKAIANKKYILRERDIVYMTGLLWSKRITIPFSRIQHAEIKQGPIERKFKLHNLKVFTAGGSSADLSIPGLTKEKADKIKAFILSKVEEEEEHHEH